MPESAPRLRAALVALFVTFLWSTSWVLIKVGLQEIPALTFAGLRYALAAAILLPFALTAERRRALASLSRRTWWLLALLGVVYYAVTQGAQFVALGSLSAASLSLLLSFTAVAVALVGSYWLREAPTAGQWVGLGVFVGGALIYTLPGGAMRWQATGLMAGLLALAANSASSLLGRRVNRGGEVDPLPVTALSMAVGAVLLLGAGAAVQGWPRLGPAQWAIVAWLALVNTAVAFTLWNRSLRTLSAMESSLINNAMLIQVPALAWVFLREALSAREVVGLLVAGVGIVLVQLSGRHPDRRPAPETRSAPRATPR